MAKERRFYLDGAASDSTLGLSRDGHKALKKDGSIDLSKLDAGQLEELERMAVTDGHPVVEGEPEGVK